MVKEFDNTEAGQEGWGIFECDGSANGPYQLQADDEAELFADDSAAWVYVVNRALDGSEYHKAAIRYLVEHNKREVVCILRHTALTKDNLKDM